MALVKCKECGNVISSKAETCPSCGVRLKRNPIGCGTVIGVVFLAGIIISSASQFISRDKVAPQGEMPTDTQYSPVPAAPPPEKGFTSSVTAHGNLIQVGDLADDVFQKLISSDLVTQRVIPDPDNPSSLMVYKRYRVPFGSYDKEFTIVFTRPTDPGPYRVKTIEIE